MEAPDAPTVLAVAGEDVKVEVGRRAPAQVLPVPPALLRAVATARGLVPLAAADGPVVDRDPYERPLDVAVAPADAVPSDAAAPPVVPRVAPVGLLVVGREVAALLVRLAHAAEVAHLRGVGVRGVGVARLRGGRVAGTVAVTVATRAEGAAAAGVAPDGQTVATRVAVAAGAVGAELGRLRPVAGCLAEEVVVGLSEVAPHDVGLAARARSGHAAAGAEVAEEAEGGPTIIISGRGVTPLSGDPPRHGRVARLPRAGVDAPTVGAVEGQAVPAASDGVLLASAVPRRCGPRPPEEGLAGRLLATAPAAPAKAVVHPRQAPA